MCVPARGRFTGAGLLVALAVVFLSVAVGVARADTAAPGNLVANPSFESSTRGWSVTGGTIESSAAPSCGTGCSGTGWDGARLGAAVSTTGTTLTVTTTSPTVSSTTGGQGYLGAVLVAAGASQTVGKTVRITLCETTSTGTVVREWSNSAALGAPGSSPSEVATGATTVSTGDRLSVRVSLLGATAGDRLWLDRVSIRPTRRVFKPATHGTSWAVFGADVTRITEPTDPSALVDGFGPVGSGAGGGWLTRVYVYVDGHGGASGSQKLRAVLYGAPNDTTYEGGTLVGSTNAVTVTAGSGGRWVAFVFPHPVPVENVYTYYGLGVQSSGTANVARWAYTPGGTMDFSHDAYADGPAASVAWPPFLTEPWTMSAYATGAQTSVYACNTDPNGCY